MPMRTLKSLFYSQINQDIPMRKSKSETLGLPRGLEFLGFFPNLIKCDFQEGHALLKMIRYQEGEVQT